MEQRDFGLAGALRSGNGDALERAFQSLLAHKSILPILRLLTADNRIEGEFHPKMSLRVASACARALLLAGQASRAADVLGFALNNTEVLSDNEESLEARLILAECRARAGRVAEALEGLAEVAAQFPQSGQIERARLSVLAQADPAAALQAVEQLDPRYLSDLSLRADVLLKNGLVDEARRISERMRSDSLKKWATLANASAQSNAQEGWAAAMDAYISAASGSNEAHICPSAASRFEALRRRAPVAAPNIAPVAQLVVVLYAKDDESSLAQAAESVLQQSLRSLRLVMVDDASRDGTRDLMCQIARRDPRVVTIANPRPLGLFHSRNLAIELVHGAYYAMHSGDRWMHPLHLERAMDAMAADPDLRAYYASLLPLTVRGVTTMEALEDKASGVFSRAAFDEVGPFDAVMAGGDDEFQWRLRAHYGGEAVQTSPQATIVELREDDVSVPVGALPGASQNRDGADYAAAFLEWHLSGDAAALRLDPEAPARPFPAPAAMLAPSRQPVDAPDVLNDDFANGTLDEPNPPLVVRWPDGGKGGQNWGDKLNPFLVRSLSGRQVVNQNDPANCPPDAPAYFVVGSGVAAARGNAIIWGSGFIGSEQKLQCPVDRIFAVRGPLTRQRVIDAGGDPALPLGDPALLLPLFYLPPIEPTFDVGIIQHFRDAGQDPLLRLPRGYSVRLIDITGGITEVIDAVLSCRTILSSSLHGLIIAHAYGRGGAWLKSSDRPLGDDFKFRDYWASMGWPSYEAHDLRVSSFVLPSDLVAGPSDALVDIFALIRACPFITAARKDELVQRAASLASGQTFFARHAGLSHALQTDPDRLR